MDEKFCERLDKCISTITAKGVLPISAVITETRFDKEKDGKKSSEIKCVLRCEKNHHWIMEFCEAISPYVTIIVIAVTMMVWFGGCCFSCCKCCCQNVTSAESGENASTNVPAPK